MEYCPTGSQFHVPSPKSSGFGRQPIFSNISHANVPRPSRRSLPRWRHIKGDIAFLRLIRNVNLLTSVISRAR